MEESQSKESLEIKIINLDLTQIFLYNESLDELNLEKLKIADNIEK